MMWSLPYLIATIAFGLCFGSFATALIYRVPRSLGLIDDCDKKKKSKKPEILTQASMWSRSACPSCGHVLNIRDLIPVFSWLFSFGKCRYCKKRISYRYPLIELITTLLALAFYYRFGWSPQLFIFFIVSSLLVAIIWIDFKYTIIPDSLNMSLAALAISSVLMQLTQSSYFKTDLGYVLFDSTVGAFVYFLLAFFLRWLFTKRMNKEALGLGDIKFFVVAGLWLGITNLPEFLFLSGASGIVLALFWKKLTGEDAFPFGPSLVLSFITILLWNGGSFFTL